MSKIFTLVLDDTFFYRFSINDTYQEDIKLAVKMDLDGSYYLGCAGIEDKLYFGIEGGRFMFYSYQGNRKSALKFLLAALPKLFLSTDKDLSWEEILPEDIIFNRSRWQLFFKSFHHDASVTKGAYRITYGREITGTIINNGKQAHTRAVIDDLKGIKEIEVQHDGNIYRLQKMTAKETVQGGIGHE